MPISFAVLGGDSRQRYLAEYLLQNGHLVSTCSVCGLPDRGDWRNADVLLLPVPSLNEDGTIRGTALSLDDLPPRAVVFGGKLPPNCGTDLLLSESYAQAGAAITAEGAIQIAMEQLPVTIAGSRFLVIGAGRIGFCLAKKLAALDALVTVTARKSRDHARLLAADLRSDDTGLYERGLDGYDCVFNTVPSLVFPKACIEQTKKSCLFVELASLPYGIDAAACKKLDRPYVLGAGLPGKVAPRSAGEIIAQEVLSQLRSRA